jgi:zinc transport system ATP-binding protein
MLLDEPTASIDTKGQNDFYGLMKELNSSIPIVVVSHDLLVISRYMKTVACVNRRLHYHREAEIAGNMIGNMCPCTVEDICPVGLVSPMLSVNSGIKVKKD